MPYISRRGRQAQAHRIHTLSLLLLGLSLLSFSLSAWFYVAVEQHLDVASLPAPLEPVARPTYAPRHGKVEAEPSPVAAPVRIAGATMPLVRPSGGPAGAPGALTHPMPTPTEDLPKTRPFVHFEPAPLTSAAGPVDPNKHVVSAPPAMPGARPASGDVASAGPQQPAAPQAGQAAPGAGGQAPRPMEGGFAQDAHRFQLGPGNAPPLTTPVDPRLTWMVIGIFSLSNFVLVAVLGGGTPSRTA